MSYIFGLLMFCGMSWFCGLLIAPFINGGFDIPEGKVREAVYLIMVGFLPTLIFVGMAS